MMIDMNSNHANGVPMHFFGIFLLLFPLRLAGTEGLFGHSSFLEGHHSSPKGSSNPTRPTLAWTGYVIVLGWTECYFRS